MRISSTWAVVRGGEGLGFLCLDLLGGCGRWWGRAAWWGTLSMAACLEWESKTRGSKPGHQTGVGSRARLWGAPAAAAYEL